MSPADTLAHGAKFPYDASEDWYESDDTRSPPPATDWAHAAARGVVADLTDRRGIKNGFDDVDDETKVEIISTMAEIIRLAHEQKVLSDIRKGNRELATRRKKP